ncbi:MAG TPA: choline dehydrogenase [Stellaceae bacterium]|nr:choline dehydrogenase [Stellaceae bacterium]
MAGEEVFDFIIVGAGSAGCVLADRLSASGKHRVLLLEAGGEDNHFWIHIPLGYGKLFTDPRVNWMYQTAPEPELNNRSISQPRGKVLGGSSSINGLLYIRGQRQDFDHWRQLGNVGWSFEDVLPYFKKSEDQQRGQSDLHGAGGPLSVQDQVEPHEICDAFIKACEETGIPRNDDFNGAGQEGAGYFQATMRNGRRWSTAKAYLKPARSRQNLTVVTRALTKRVLFVGNAASGVEYRHEGLDVVARTRGEVILSAGAFGSPQLLQLSGIGPSALLREHGIPVLRDRPSVGADLQDHLQARMLYRVTKPVTLNDVVNRFDRKIAAGLRYFLFRKGPMAVSAGYAGGFFRTDPRLETPDVQAHLLLFSADKPGGNLHPWPGMTASICQLRPESRGWVRIKSADASMAPEIRLNYLATDGDKRTMVEGLKLLRRIMAAPALKPYVASESDPGSGVADDAGLLGFIRARGTTIFHPTTSCRMGIDQAAVVDPELRVNGVGKLRVVDASIMPTVVSGNTNAATIMIGEKAADLILRDAQATPERASAA